MAEEIGIQDPVFTEADIAQSPPSITEAAKLFALSLADAGTVKFKRTVRQLLGTYVLSKDVDVAVFYNSGGMGWNHTEESQGGGSILDGIAGQLRALGYKSSVFNYSRTGRTLYGILREFVEASSHYPRKVNDLVGRVKFLMGQLPDLKIIIAGESTGTVISEETMRRFNGDTRVYSIQTGVPFWYRSCGGSRTWLINNNGKGPDVFSYGNVPVMLWATVKGFLGFVSASDKPGDIFKWLKAPGHDYSWQYPGVAAQIEEFLKNNFPNK